MSKTKRRPQRPQPEIEFPMSTTVLDIVIPVYGQPALLKDCLAAVAATCLDVDYTLIVVDDKSPNQDEMKAVYATLPKNAVLAHNPKNSGFPGAANIGAAAGKSPAILFLNTDVVVKSGCIKTMLNTLNESPSTLPHNGHFDKQFVDAAAGIVAPKLLFPAGNPHENAIGGHVQHAGMAFSIAGQAIHRCLNWPADHERVNKRLSMQIVTGACLMTKRSVWRSAWATYQERGDTQTRGGFNEVYGRGTFEDLEYCLASRGFRHKVIYEPGAVAVHLAGGSSGVIGLGYDLERNLAIFNARCKKLIMWDEWCYW